MCAVCMGRHEAVPEISVLMGVYYRRESLDLLRRSIQSILEQSFSNFEFLICDDGSSEAARTYIRAAAEKDSRIRIIERHDMFTLSAKLNICLQAARGPFIARMDDDDCAHLDRFEKQLTFMQDRPELSFVGSNVELWNNGQRVGIRKLPEHPEVQNFLFTQPYVHPAMMFRRTVLLDAGGYSEDKYCILCEDYDLLLRLYEKGCHGANLQECLLDYTIPDTAKGSRKMKHRWNETVTRYRRFRDLHLLPGALPYVVKPIAVGVLPDFMLPKIKRWKYRKHSNTCQEVEDNVSYR